MKIVPKPVVTKTSTGNTVEHQLYELVDENSGLTVLHLEPFEETYRAKWETAADLERFEEVIERWDPPSEADITANFYNEERDSEDSLTADYDTIRSQNIHDESDCTSMTLDSGVIELTWSKENEDQYIIDLHSHDGTFTPLGASYEAFPYAHNQEISDDYEEFVEAVLNSAEGLLQEELTISV